MKVFMELFKKIVSNIATVLKVMLLFVISVGGLILLFYFLAEWEFSFNSPGYVHNIILIGSTNDRSSSQTVSVGGDSGNCVYRKETGRLIGMLLGGNRKFSFVLPLQETLNSFNFKLS